MLSSRNWDKTVNILLPHPFDPLGDKVGGIETFVKGFIKYAPEGFVVEHIGTTACPSERPLGVWQSLPLGSGVHRYCPILYEPAQNTKRVFPESLRFTILLSRFRRVVPDRILLFNRLELALAFLGTKHKKIGIVHDDVIELVKPPTDSLWRCAPTFYRQMEKIVLGSLNRVSTVSAKTFLFYRRRFRVAAEKINLLTTWVDQDIFFPSEPRRNLFRKKLSVSLGMAQSGNWLLFVGRLKAQKAPHRLLKSFFEYVKINRKAYLIIIGDGNLRHEVVTEARRLGIHSRIRLLGYKSQEELTAYYQTADCLVLTSNYEGMPMCCLEALACGLPVVATDVGEMRKIVQNGYSGELVANFSPKSIAMAINKIIRRPHKYGKQNCVNSVRSYTPQSVLGDVYLDFSRLAAQKS
jgi:glycosyltransferase involved in cell wall biosynthesis